MDKLKKIVTDNKKWEAVFTKHISRIEAYGDTDYDLVAGNCKSLIDGVTKTIIQELNPTIDVEELNKLDTAQLLNASTKLLKIAKEYQHLIAGSRQIIEGFRKIRNKEDSQAHGKSAYQLEEAKDSIDKIEINFIINCCENLVVFLIDYYEVAFPYKAKKQINPLYEDFSDFNKWLDEKYEVVKVGNEYEYLASEVLFYTDDQAYHNEMLIYEESK